MAQVVEIFPYGKIREPVYPIVNTMAADDLAMQGARASIAMVLHYFIKIFWPQLQKG